jgi:hypothetical protein
MILHRIRVAPGLAFQSQFSSNDRVKVMAILLPGGLYSDGLDLVKQSNTKEEVDDQIIGGAPTKSQTQALL